MCKRWRLPLCAPCCTLLTPGAHRRKRHPVPCQHPTLAPAQPHPLASAPLLAAPRPTACGAAAPAASLGTAAGRARQRTGARTVPGAGACVQPWWSTFTSRCSGQHLTARALWAGYPCSKTGTTRHSSAQCVLPLRLLACLELPNCLQHCNVTCSIGISGVRLAFWHHQPTTAPAMKEHAHKFSSLQLATLQHEMLKRSAPL